MKWISILGTALLLLVACDREAQQVSEETPQTEPAESPAPEPASPPHLPGVERLVDLRNGKSPRDYQEVVAEFIRDNPDLQVIAGVGWDRSVFTAAPPHKDQLDQVDDFIPIVLFSRGRNTAWVNSEALAAAGIDAGTPNPPGGIIEKDEGGLPNGLVRGAAVELVEKIIPKEESDD